MSRGGQLEIFVWFLWEKFSFFGYKLKFDDRIKNFGIFVEKFEKKITVFPWLDEIKYRKQFLNLFNFVWNLRKTHNENVEILYYFWVSFSSSIQKNLTKQKLQAALMRKRVCVQLYDLSQSAEFSVQPWPFMLSRWNSSEGGGANEKVQGLLKHVILFFMWAETKIYFENGARENRKMKKKKKCRKFFFLIFFIVEKERKIVKPYDNLRFKRRCLRNNLQALFFLCAKFSGGNWTHHVINGGDFFTCQDEREELFVLLLRRRWNEAIIMHESQQICSQ